MIDYPMCLISWNVAYRVKRQPEQLARLLDRRPHVIALQECPQKPARLWCEGLSEAGFEHILTTFDLAADPEVLTGGRRYGQILASCWPLDPLLPSGFDIPWPERVLSAIIQAPTGDIEIHTTHIPAGRSHGWTKIDTFVGIHKRLARRSPIPRILCGDFNSPKQETEDGTVLTFGERMDSEGNIISERDGRWAEGEHSVITGLAQYDLPDVYRMLHGYRAQEVSWSRQIYRQQHGGRFDHVFASRMLNPVKCEYVHAFREDGLSDHSPLEVRADALRSPGH